MLFTAQAIIILAPQETNKLFTTIQRMRQT